MPPYRTMPSNEEPVLSSLYVKTYKATPLCGGR
jgi:hypothetical protein